MFDKILIANRGEIAVRIIRTCNRLGIGAVAVYSEADSRSLHRLVADEAIFIGGAPARQSYLDMDRIVSAALAANCRAVHPGYGFLSENSRFAEMVTSAGLAFIGPPAGVIAAMGDKIASKELAIKAGVPVIPGHVSALSDLEEALGAAQSVGYPVLLKPAAGGGGKGMRIVFAPQEMEAALAACRQETLKAFGDSRIFIERYIEQPRHVEIQVLADTLGNVIHLGERECSIQRRYQKIIEESPSTAISEDIRQSMGQAACELARKAGYVNAGTVEFVLDPKGRFYFLEMNTRLQVEHPVTEKVTGLDLVELQLKIAAGEPIPFGQEEVVPNGWAMEARICAEDPSRGFMPSTGMITRYAEPHAGGLRVDSGVTTGSWIGVYYDSMLAKVISHGKNREEARIGLIEALNGYHIEGVVTNIDFVNSVLCHPEFAAGNLSTGFIEQHFDGGTPKQLPDPRNVEMGALAAALVYHMQTVAIRESLRPMVSLIGGRREDGGAHNYIVRTGEHLFEVLLEKTQEVRRWTIHVNGRAYDVVMPQFEFYRRRLRLTIDGQVHRFRLKSDQSFVFVAFSGITSVFEVYMPKEWALLKYMPAKVEKPSENALVCPMPGLVVDVLAAKGDRVFRGQNLVVLESMKMESGVASPKDGIIEEVRAVAGQAVETGDILMRFKA
ncbi:MAG: acetyl-CoA carboxylase biotin carboxylase subunit [Syntrophobacteraceae bacterium]|nr:acetyl-CoA carboxylase biotin carboxylase subunit [Syntrophobacteraceae bacterium]